MKNLEEIIRYLDHEMTGDETQLFENELKNNPELFEKTDFVKEVDSALADEEYFIYLERLKCAQSEYYISDEEVKNLSAAKHYKLKIQWKYFSVAAAVGLFFVVSAILYKNLAGTSNEKLFKEYYTKYEANILTRSESNNNSILVQAIQLYDRGSYAEAITDFNSILKTDASNTAVHFFLGVSYMETHNFKSAIKNLTFVLVQNDTVFVEHARWYLAMCYLKTNQIKQASQILTKIANSKNFYTLMASDLLKKLKS